LVGLASLLFSRGPSLPLSNQDGPVRDSMGSKPVFSSSRRAKPRAALLFFFSFPLAFWQERFFSCPGPFPNRDPLSKPSNPVLKEHQVNISETKKCPGEWRVERNTWINRRRLDLLPFHGRKHSPGALVAVWKRLRHAFEEVSGAAQVQSPTFFSNFSRGPPNLQRMVPGWLRAALGSQIKAPGPRAPGIERTFPSAGFNHSLITYGGMLENLSTG